MITRTEELMSKLTGKNKSFIKRVSKHQEEKYGNVDIFDYITRSKDDIEIQFGEMWIRFFFRDGKVYDTLGTGQGHKYQSNLQSCVEEIRSKL